MALWLSGRCRDIAGVRRSHGLGGMVPHFVHVRDRGHTLTLVEYVPLQRKPSLFSRGDLALLFAGRYRVRRFHLVAEGTGDSLREAARAASHFPAKN